MATLQLFSGLLFGIAGPLAVPPTPPAALVYLNFDGATLTPPPAGEREYASKGQAELVSRLGKPSLTIPAMQFTDFPRDVAIAAILADLKKYYAGLNIEWVTEPPIDDRYSMVVVGGSSEILGIEERELGWGPTDCNNQNPRNVAFVFPETIKAVAPASVLTQVAATIAQEYAHAVGLEHIEGPNDLLMRPVPAIVAQYRFGDSCLPIVPGPAVGPEGPGCGAHPSCPDRQQNDRALLEALLGVKPQTPNPGAGGAGTTGGGAPGGSDPGSTGGAAPGASGGGDDKGCSVALGGGPGSGFALLFLGVLGISRRRRS